MDRKSLRNIDEICEVGGFSKPYFYKYLELGLPARKIFGRWRAHTTNIEIFMQQLTKVGADIEDPEEAKKALSIEKIVQKS